MRSRSCLFALLLVAAAGAAPAACGSDDEQTPAKEKTPAEKFCAALADYVQSCGASSPCDEALVADCADVAAMLNDSYLAEAASCINEGNPPTSCLTSSVTAIAPSDAHHAFAAKVCKECAFGIDGCEDLFFSEGDGETQIVGNLVLPLGDSLVTEIGEECATGLTCLPSFPTCVQGVLAKRAIPAETISCLLDPPAVSGEAAEPCEEMSGSGNGGGPPTSASSTASTGVGTGGAGNGGSGNGGSGGDTQHECAEQPTQDACVDCCVEVEATAYDLLITAILDECACKLNTPCNGVCGSACTQVDGGSPECADCVNNAIALKAQCFQDGQQICADQADCAPIFACGNDCPDE